MRGFVIAATGLRAEGRIAARSDDVRAVAGGGDGARLAQLIERLIAEGGQAIISFGLAAGLAPSPPGTCLVGSEVVHAGRAYRADAAWAAHIKRRLGISEPVTIAGVDHPLTSALAKRTLNAETGAVAADMESYIVAQLATRHGLPFAVLRVIADPAERAIPSAALLGMRRDGGIDVLAVLSSLVKRPGQLPALLRLAADTRAAMAGLLRCHDLLGAGLGFRDLA
ncbi:MAG: phosphorylase family protein [Methyloceanibacter sp.]